MGRHLSYFLTFFIVLQVIFTGSSHNGDDGTDQLAQDKIRILFLLDASFSMKEKWQTRTKFEIASDLLVELIEASYASDPNKEFAIRIFGHQTGMKDKDCLDSRLEVDFRQQNLLQIKRRLDRIHPKGWSPIAYSLKEAIEDFPEDPQSLNAIVFITDGGETCSGNPCEAARNLREHRIEVKPFVIGLGKSELLREDVGCIGDYQQVASEAALRNSLNKIIEKVDLRTNVQVLLREEKAGRLETNIPVSIVNSSRKNTKSNFVHALDGTELRDTMTLSLLGTYDFIAHTMPEVSRTNVRLAENNLNKIELETPQGYLELALDGYRGFADFECLVRDAESLELINVQEFETTKGYLSGRYLLEVSSKPRINFAEIEILPGETRTISVSRSGTLLIENPKAIVGSLFTRHGKRLVKVEEYYNLSGYNSFHLQPGDYVMVYRVADDLKAENTVEYNFSIKPGRVHILKL